MGRTAVGTTGTFRKGNGGSQEDDIGITGSSFSCRLSLGHHQIILLKSLVSVENKLTQFCERSELNREYRQREC